MSDEETGTKGQKLRLILDRLHGEEYGIFDKLIELLSERCEVSVLKTKPLNLNTLTENDVFLLISPGKSWDESEIAIVRRYVESEGGILVAMTREGRKPEHLNKLLEPFGLSVIEGTVAEKYLEGNSLQYSQLREGVKLLALGSVWGWKSTRLVVSNESEVVLQYKDAILGAKRILGKGTVYVFSCVPLFGNKQLERLDNRRFLNNLLESMATPVMAETLRAIATDKALPKEKEDIKVLIKKLRHKDEIMVREATEALVDMGEAAIGPLIEEDLANTSQVVTHTYAAGREVEMSWPSAVPLAQIGEPAVGPLIQVVRSYPEQGQSEKEAIRRFGAAITLGLIGDKRPLQPLIESFEYDPSAYEGAAIALGMIGDPQAVEPLIRRLGKEDYHFKCPKEIIQALGKSEIIPSMSKLNVSLISMGFSQPHTNKTVYVSEPLELAYR